MNIKNHTETIRLLTKKMDQKEKFALVNFPRSALMLLSELNNGDRKSNKNFARSIKNSFEINHNNYLKSVPLSFVNSSIESGASDISRLLGNNEYCDSTTLEFYYSSREDIFKYFVQHYIKHSSFIIVSFHDKKMITKTLGTPMQVINVPYNDFYDKTDSIFENISQFDGKIDYCLFDCPLLSSALPYKIWNELNMSIIDLGKVFSFARSNYLNKMKEQQNEKRDRPKYVRR